MYQNDSEYKNTQTWNKPISCGFPTCEEATISEARNAFSVLLRFIEGKGDEYDMACITSL